MLFASDLDQTLIYSPKSFRLAADEQVPSTVLVEMHGGRKISFVAAGSVTRLIEIAKKAVFVPATTRTIEQYRRIMLFQREITPQYAIVSNGGNILIHGAVDTTWKHQVQIEIKQQAADKDVIWQRFQEIAHDFWVLSSRTADELFSYCIVERDRVPLNDLEAFGLWAKSQRWNVSLQGRKLYLVPEVINKWNAIKYIKELAGSKTVVAAGDSLLDLCMLENADIAIAPCHGELWERQVDGKVMFPHIQFTKRAGIHAAEEILGSVISFF